MTPTGIPNYDILRRVGKGGMAEVFLAKHKTLDRFVAIKVIDEQLVDDAEAGFVERFRQEGKIAASLRHTGIVQVFDADSADGSYYIVMEYLSGGSLAERIRQGLSPAQAVAIVRQLAEGLEVAHARGIVHRDIKPRNIMFHDDDTPVITDFGIAKMLTPQMQMSMTVASVGTPIYMSPEQYWDSSHADARSDIYSLGVLFFEMLAGWKPFAGTSPAMVQQQKEKELIPSLPEPVARFQPIILRMLAREPAARYPTIRAFLDDLQAELSAPQALEETGTAVREPQPAEASHHRRLPIWLWAIAILGVIGLPIAWVLASREAPSDAVAVQPQTAPPAAVPSVSPPVFSSPAPTPAPAAIPAPAPVPFSIVTAELLDGRPAAELMYLPGGTFLMGSPSSEAERWPDESQHEARLGGFYLGVHEVTVGQFTRFIAATGYRTDAERDPAQGCWGWADGKDGGDWAWRAGRDWRNPGFEQGDDHPVVCVSWADAMAYVTWLNGETGGGFRLPSEAEWEYAARGGTATSRFWGDDALAACGHANVGDRAIELSGPRWNGNHGCNDGHWFTAPVGAFTTHPWGLADMLGNVWEWTCSGWDERYEGAHLTCAEPAADGWRTLRGGGWDSDPRSVRAAARFRNTPSYRLDTVGFRVARTLSETSS